MPVPGRGVYLADDRTGWRHHGYPELAGAAWRMAARLAAAGVRPGDVVCLTVPTEYHSLVTVFGVWAAGATLCPLPPVSFQPDQEYVDHLAAVLRQAAPSAVVTSVEFAPLVEKAMIQADFPGQELIICDADASPAEAPAGPPAQPAEAAKIALLQFTSGSTGTPQGVRVSWANLTANLAVQRRWAHWRPGEGVASWLPLYHDMGLIGCLLFAVAGQCDLWLMKPGQFIRNPRRWLECFGPDGARHAAAPSFAFAYLTRRLAAGGLAGLDLSQWRSVIVGAEAVDAAVLDRFAEFAAPTGFSRATFAPAYGLAENTLGVTSPGRQHDLRLVRPRWEALRLGEPVHVSHQARLGEELPVAGPGWLVGHGVPDPADGIEVQVVGENGAPLPAGRLGEIVVSGTSVALGYQGDHAERVTRFAGGVLRTGDAGFFHEGELYVVGRMGDSLKLRGRSVYVEDLDAKVAEAAELTRDRVAVVSSAHGGLASVLVFAEARPGDWAERVTKRLRGELGPEPGITIVTGTRGMIQRTSSGKPRRRQMWHLFTSGQLKNAAVIETPAESAEEPNP